MADSAHSSQVTVHLSASAIARLPLRKVQNDHRMFEYKLANYLVRLKILNLFLKRVPLFKKSPT